MSNELSLDDFLGHSTMGNRTNVLGNWKKEKPQIDVLLHTKAPIVAVWQHSFPYLKEVTRNNVEVVEVWSGTFNTWEPETVCRNQYKRADGVREYPPTICPMAMFLEAVRERIEEGTLDWTDELFKFVGTDTTNQTEILHAGGMTNMFGKKKMSDEEAGELTKAGIRVGEAWKQASLAKCKYVFRLVVVDDVVKGVQVAEQTTAVGDATRAMIRDAREAAPEGTDDGNPLVNPYVIRWKYNKDAANFGDKYKAVAMPNLDVPQDALDLVRDTDPPSISHMTSRSNPLVLQAAMEEHYTGPDGLFNWDEIFAPSVEIWNKENAQEEAPATAQLDDAVAAAEAAMEEDEAPAKPAPRRRKAATPKAEEPAEEPAPSKPPPRRRRKAATPVEKPVDPMQALRDRVLAEDRQSTCSECDKVIDIDDDVCPFCGFDYADDEVEAAPPEPVKPPPRRRRAAKPAATPAKKVAAATPVDTGDDLGF